jgi:Uma2 family endonuclease
MSTLLAASFNDCEIRIPHGITDNAAFLRWATSKDAPEKGKYAYLGDHLWIDASMETLFHNQIKSIIARHVGLWVEQQELGDYFDDGMLMSRPDLEFSSQPDGMFVSNESWNSGRAKLQQSDKSLVILGSPDMVLEVISKSSTIKDQKTKKVLYHRAGIKEYWLVDSRLETPYLVIYRHAAKTYVPVKATRGWVKSQVLGATFRLVVEKQTQERRKVKLERI